ncbi:DUF4062 domain-containing protein [Microbacterium sp. USTB-Y]|uniref:DUF4062 domain-containing protein n=1 Tax=Microbacterium sp. USTB-Y TaxID=2823692 RepID=UPI00203FED0D|nr:DUF4062 domain-containing protein [Microbacterium sp. USTB-Y]
MTSIATVVYVMIASPSDVSEARDAVYAALGRWNEANTASRGVVLVPLRWETGTVPVLGDHPQAIINRQLLKRSDVVIALFGSRLGAATGSALSGTAEEIELAVAGGKPVHLYFSTAPHPNDVDPLQLVALADFRRDLEGRGLYGTFGSAIELTAHVWQALEHDISQLDPVAVDRAGTARVDLLVQQGSERTSESDARGRLRTRNHKWIDIINRGDADAEGLEVEPAVDGVFLGGSERPRTLHAGQSQRFPYELSLAASDALRVRVSWEEDGQRVTREFDA